MSAVSVDRALPAIPVASTTERPALPRLNLRDLPPMPTRQPSLPSPLSPLPAPPVTPTNPRGQFLLSPDRYSPALPSPTRSQSPSIRNLDQRSVVKQRLAQIERVSSSSGGRRTGSPASPSTRRWELRDLPRMVVARQDSRASNASILDSYAAGDGSPRSMCSGRLTTVPPSSAVGSPTTDRGSRFGLQIEDNGVGDGGGGPDRFLAPPKREDGEALFSPASRYSDDDGDNAEGQLVGPGAASQIRSALEALAIPAPARVPTLAHATDETSATSEHPPPHREINDSEASATLQTIRNGVEALKGRSVADSTNIINVRTNVDEVLTEVRHMRAAQSEPGPGVAVNAKLEEVKSEIKGDISTLRGLVEGLTNVEGVVAQAGVSPDVSELHAKLDGLLRLCQNRGMESGDNGSDARPTASELAEVLTMLKDAEEQRVTQMEQQTDSIRYLNELNCWLEAFVKHGTSQIEGVAAGIQQLCQDLGPVPELQDAEGEGEAPPGGSLLSDIRRLLVQHKEREEQAVTLHSSVNGLVAAVQEDMRRNAEARNLMTTESVVGMIDRQRQDQERMLRALATELSNDIRGERLRFVEAMKEATAINVQIHVEEFKKELTREVMLMTQEVTRLQRERQGLEQQIADLFAFYAKQKQAGKVRSVVAQLIYE
ncbi:hypothetical protein C8Q77DRAFT_1136552 [Trametes polyzona]|nr:hypothetical protein C8Q77DRAFT_1136552 [Trametes polyzona]